MAILDILKRKKEEEVKSEKKGQKKERKNKTRVPKKPKKQEKPKESEESKSEPEPQALKPRAVHEAYAVLDEPHVTEKASLLAEKNQYVFKVLPRANKIMVKRAVENMYGVNVLIVRILSVKGKEKKVGRTIGWEPGYKKAIVRIRADQKIDIMPR